MSRVHVDEGFVVDNIDWPSHIFRDFVWYDWYKTTRVDGVHHGGCYWMVLR